MIETAEIDKAHLAKAVERLHGDLGEANREITALKVQLAEMTKDRDEWKRVWEMYANAWKRELGRYGIYNKSHLIDALVKTTREIVDKYEEWKTATAALKEKMRLMDIAATLGWTGKLPE